MAFVLATVLTQEWAAIAQDLHQIPLVQVCRNTESEHIDVVNIDGYRAGEEIAGLLIEQGHRRFGYMKGPDTQSSHLLRMEGYRDKLMAAGFQLDRVLTAGHYDRQRGFQLMSEYLQATPESERVEALFCENDVLALGALEALRQTAPSSAMAVVGFDDIDEAGSANWALTSYSQRIDRLVEEALNRLIDNRATADGAAARRVAGSAVACEARRNSDR